MLRQICAFSGPHTRAFSVSVSTSARIHRPPPELELAEETQTPRWLRRQNLQKGKAKEQEVIPPIVKETPKFRSKHLTSDGTKDKEGSKEGLKLLEPHVLSQRLKKLCDRGKLDDAVALLKNSPSDAQNTPVWNTVIWEAMKAKRHKLAYSLYVDMKRRGHSPTTRTFLTMFNGLARIDDFSHHTQQLKNARSLYDAFTRHLKSIKRVDPTNPELSIDPLASYIKILGDAKCYNDIFDVFDSLDSDGPLAPNQLIYTSIFQSLASRPDNTDIPTTFRQADARLIWSQAIKASKRQPHFVIDSHLATAAISALTRSGQTSDHDLGFQIARDFFGLCPPGTPRVTGTLPLSTYSLSAIFRLCNASQNYDLCIDFFNQVKRRPVNIGSVELLDRLHMDDILRAHQALNVPASGYQSLQTLEWMLRQELTGPNGGKIRPQASTYDIVLVTCWHSADWNSATRTFDLMSGFHSHDFMDGSVADSPRFSRRAKGRNIVPTAETISSLVRTAHATRNRAHMRQCLRLVDHLGIDTLLARTSEVAYESRRTLKDRGFFVAKLAQGVVEMVKYVLSGTTDQRYPEEQDKWKRLAERAKMELRESGEEALIPTLRKRITESGSPLSKTARAGPTGARGKRERWTSVAAS
ncbi:hypothetical protein P691DRAFT_723501 [Macrolepiota fuliginosa MF-IS2]|uniref:Pentatricopeptide repeat protein n=1 Tax=Macrolepiota fuliginosa MF-IS2 TaxID=1400762 RepID=A0A9P6C7B7_9AGAR|nr:hypothetical protein P691DRAFT_723501 [Macrolepiota fuliginosa MF-IS2]